MGIGAEDALVRVTPLSHPEKDAASIAREVLEELLSRMKIPATVELQVGEESTINLEVVGDDLGILIGRRGQTLYSIQFIVRLIVAHRLREMVPISIDVEGYRKRRREALRELALRMAEQVRTSGQSVTLEPMPPDERRTLHLVLADMPDITTISVGEGEARKVTIIPKGRT